MLQRLWTRASGKSAVFRRDYGERMMWYVVSDER